LYDIIFGVEVNNDIDSLIKSGIISDIDIDRIENIIQVPVLSKIIRYLTAVNDRRGDDKLSSKDAYAKALVDLIAFFGDVLKAKKRVAKMK